MVGTRIQAMEIEFLFQAALTSGTFFILNHNIYTSCVSVDTVGLSTSIFFQGSLYLLLLLAVNRKFFKETECAFNTT